MTEAVPSSDTAWSSGSEGAFEALWDRPVDRREVADADVGGGASGFTPQAANFVAAGQERPGL